MKRAHTVKSAGMILGKTPEAIRRAIKSGVITATRSLRNGFQYRISQEEVIRQQNKVAEMVYNTI